MAGSVGTSVILRERRGGVAHLRMNRPSVLNVLDEELAREMRAAFEDVAADETVRAVILSGEGRSFMAGGDLARFAADLPGAPRTAAGLIESFHAIMRCIKAMPQPVIAAVHGPVAGGGVGLALACDLVIAADDTSFLSAYTRLGTNPDGGTSWSVTRLLGPRRALAFLLLNDRLDAASALQQGLVNSVVSATDLLPIAMSVAERLASACRSANSGVKQLVQAAQAGSFDEQLELEKEGFIHAAGTADFREGITAFFERRSPRFS